MTEAQPVPEQEDEQQAAVEWLEQYTERDAENWKRQHPEGRDW